MNRSSKHLDRLSLRRPLLFTPPVTRSTLSSNLPSATSLPAELTCRNNLLQQGRIVSPLLKGTYLPGPYLPLNITRDGRLPSRPNPRVSLSVISELQYRHAGLHNRAELSGAFSSVGCISFSGCLWPLRPVAFGCCLASGPTQRFAC